MMARFTLVTGLLAANLLVSPARAQNRDYEAERRQIELMEREIRTLENNVRALEGNIKDRKQQLADAPKTIDPAVKEMNDLTKRHEDAKAALPAVRKNLDAAQEKLTTVMKSLKADYDGADEMDAQEKKILEAKAKLEKTREKVVQTMKDDPEHIRLTKHIELMEIRVRVLKRAIEDGKGLNDDLVQASSELLNLQTELDAIESAVLEKSEEYKKAEKELAEAENTLDYLRAQMAEKLKSNPEFKAASDVHSAAKEQFALATVEVRDATRARFEAVAKVNKLKAQVKTFEAETNTLIGRKDNLERQLRVKEQRLRDFRRNIGR